MKKKSNQRITKIKIDQILRLLERAEDIPVEDATIINPATDQLTPYPDMDNLRIWTRDYLTKGLDKIIFNKFDSDSQTYMTTLVDGLPLFTKMSKTLKTKKYTDSYIFSDQVIIDNSTSIDPVTGIISYPTQSSRLRIPISESIYTNGTFSFTFKLSSFGNSSCYLFNMGNYRSDGSYVPYSQGFISYSDKNLQYNFATGNYIESPELSLDTWYTFSYTIDSNLNIIVNLISEDGTKLIDNQKYSRTYSGYTNALFIGYGNDIYLQIDATKCSFGNESNKVLLYKTTQTESEINIETSKPGLWLSNLVQPISGSTAGSWLRSNLINSNESSYNLTNSDTIGNYSNTFTQPALIMENNFAYNDKSCEDIIYPSPAFLDNERAILYNQHFSPSSQGSISYVNQPSNNARYGQPDNYFLYKYGSYQSISFPKDPDTQTYIESEDSCLKYNFYNSDSKIDFIMKAPNSKQTPQALRSLKFTPNTDSSGGTISGSLSSTDDNGTECTQNINYKFKSTQAIFNPNISHEYGEDNLGNINVNITKVKGTLQTCHYWIQYAEGSRINELVSGLYIFSLNTRMVSGRSFNYWVYGNSSSDLSQQTTSSSYPNYAYFEKQSSTDHTVRPVANYDSNGYCGTTIGNISGYVMTSDSTFDKDQTDIPLYLHIKDLAKEYRDKIGYYINSDCFGNAYEIYVSIDETPKAYETVYPIFNSVNIDRNGIISGLSEIDIPL